jgi:hypothetical protein
MAANSSKSATGNSMLTEVAVVSSICLVGSNITAVAVDPAPYVLYLTWI